MPLADLESAKLPSEENDLSRRYLDIITRWAHVGMATYQDWPVRPNCGHFFGGVHWYGMETSYTIATISAAASSPDFNAAKAGYSADELRKACLRGMRYLLFTHDTGPADCIRPEKGWGRPEPAGTKWGEKGKGFFPESQCAWTISALVKTAVAIRDLLTEEELAMLGAIAAGYIERFGRMAPQSGVHENTQTEENAWTALGLVCSLLILPEVDNADTLWQQVKLWMFRTSTIPQDQQNTCSFDDDKTVSEWCGRTFTTLPDFTAENHGVVHPTYMSSAVMLSGMAMDILRLFGKPIPEQIYWHRREIYELTKRWCDSLGYPISPQGMDWPYLRFGWAGGVHSVANCYYHDADAARLEECALAVAEQASESRDGAMISDEVKRNAHSVQDPMVMSEFECHHFAQIYLRHRLIGPGSKPSSDAAVQEGVRGVYHYPAGGLVVHNHAKGISSLSWRNRTMVLPSPTDGIRTIGHVGNSMLGTYRVSGRGTSANNRRIVVRELPDRVSALLIQDLACDSIRRMIFFCSLPDGRGVSYEVAHALSDVTVEQCALGYLQIINDGYFKPKGIPSTRRIRWESGSEEFKGYLSSDANDNITRELNGTDWVSVDDRMGFRIAGSGTPVYVNKHYHKVYHAVYDELILGRHPANRQFKSGDKIAELAVLWCPDQAHDATKLQPFSILKTPPDIFAADVGDWLCACNFGLEAFKTDDVLLEPMEPRLSRSKK